MWSTSLGSRLWIAKPEPEAYITLDGTSRFLLDVADVDLLSEQTIDLFVATLRRSFPASTDDASLRDATKPSWKAPEVCLRS